MRASAFLFMAALALQGCAAVQPRTPAQSVYAVEGEYSAALAIAVAYRQLPDCSTGAALCSDNTTILKLRAADGAAWAAIMTAEDAVRAGTSDTAYVEDAENDVSAFAALTAALKTK